MDQENTNDGSAVDLEDVPLEWLENELTTMTARISASYAVWLGSLAAYDRRNGWESWGCRSAAAWLNWKCGMSLSTAHDHVRVARALEDLPVIAAAFRLGEISYSKVRAMTRVATPEIEEDLLSMALATTASGIETICAGIRTADRVTSESEHADDAWKSRSLTSVRNHDGTVTFTVTMLTEDADALTGVVDDRVGTMIDAALAEYPKGERPGRRDIITARCGLTAIRLDALLDVMFTDGVTAELSVLVDINTFTDGGADSSADDKTDCSAEDSEDCSVVSMCEIGGWRIAPEVARRLGCDASMVALIEDSAGNPVAVGDKAYVVSRKLRRALQRRDDHMCQFHGCGVTRGLHAHHIIHWAHGGPTELSNLILLCQFHHHLMHEGGWNIHTGLDGTHDFVNTEGVIAGIDVFRGRLDPLPPAVSPHVMGNTPAERVEDLSWITAYVIHNRTIRQQRSAEQTHANEPKAA